MADRVTEVLEDDVSGDGGVLKEIVTEGHGDMPPTDYEVEVHYTGKLKNGTEFDSSRKRGQPFKFQLGAGQVIKGWEVGVAAMKKGERANLTISAEYGYGAGGSGAKIPPNSTLIFDVELLDFQPKKKEKWMMSHEERAEAALSGKQEGNESFKRGDVAAAATQYEA
eukprot:Selendium_serpulae@DN4387_c0_g1_i2.p1